MRPLSRQEQKENKSELHPYHAIWESAVVNNLSVP
jgi:hypothetical protein